ncbi:hypothetical protein Lgra_2355 [Legionella gratiana]|uniref:Uncharacterized protein n=1 Tax=Legionella gratiana TaxID=45066 RepID=A0A378JEA1_9GAMM|nr:hypothetical protein [Legionella gratiana]KTD09120.1 hypothetical protein Lgra_2355 [Legionella gratiana]STX45666.1 Uncharacterised protein [Legionella gratiana]
MDPSNEKDIYEARILIENEIIFKTTGKNLDDLKICLSEKCDQEHSGAEGEIVEIISGSIMYRCHKQTIIDQ